MKHLRIGYVPLSDAAVLIAAATRGFAEAEGLSIELVREVPEGVQCEVIHAYSLELPPDFRPSNQDGEVAEVRLVPLGEALRLARDTDEMTVDAALVALDYFSRARAP